MVINDRDDKIYDPIEGKAFTPNKPILPTEFDNDLYVKVPRGFLLALEAILEDEKYVVPTKQAEGIIKIQLEKIQGLLNQ